MKNAAAAGVIATMLLTAPAVEARDRRAGMVVSSTAAGLIASAQGCSPQCGRAMYVGMAPAIFGYGYRLTYYGNGFSYQPAWYPAPSYYAEPRFPGCCRW